MKVLVIDTDILQPQIQETPGGLDEWKRLIKCSLITISYLQIAGKYYDIIGDDEALLKAGGKVTAIDTDKNPQLVGNLVICNYDGEGGEAGLTEDDIKHIMQNIVVLTEDKAENPQKWIAVNNVQP